MVQILMMLCGMAIGEDAVSNHLNIPPALPNKELSAQVWDGYYTADLNTRYHQEMAARYGTWDLCSRITAIVLGAAAVMAPLILGFKKIWVRFACAIVGAISLLAAILLTTFGFDKNYQVHAALATRWCELKNDWNELRNERETLPQDQLMVKVHRLRGKQTSIEMSEPPGPDHELHARCQAALNHSLGIEDGKEHRAESTPISTSPPETARGSGDPQPRG